MKLLFTTILILSSIIVKAQDVITLRSGGTIKAVVKEISKEVKYKQWANKTGPLYSILKKDIAQIKFMNGLVEIFEAEKSPVIAPPATQPIVSTPTTPVQQPMPVVTPIPKPTPEPAKAETVETYVQANQLPPPIPRRGSSSASGTAFAEGASFLSANVSFPSGYTIYGLNYEYGVSDEFGVGFGAAHASVPIYVYSYYGSYYDNLSAWAVSADASYHLSKVMSTDRFDLIPTLSLGKAFISGYTTDVILSGQMGARYFVTEKVAMGANISFGISKSSTATAGISVTFRLN